MDPALLIVTTIINVIFGTGTVAAGIVAYSQRHKLQAETEAVAATVAEKAVNNALEAQAAALDFFQARNKALGGELADYDLIVRKLQKRARDAEERLYLIEQEQKKDQQSRIQLLTTFAIAIRYINALRLQLEQISETPLPWPMALEEWLIAYSPEKNVE